MTTTDPDPFDLVVFGERLGDLWPALLQLYESRRVGEDGMHHFSFELEPKDANPFRRAMLRAEAELLCEEADLVGGPNEIERTPEQRGADALLRMVQELS